MTLLRRIVPTRATWAALVGLLSAISFGAVRDFVWADLREGTVRLRDLPPATRFLALLGFGMLFVMIGVLLFNDLLRAGSPLEPLTDGSPGRGASMPLALMPVTLFALSMAWSFLLTGALHARRIVRGGAVALYTLFALLWTVQITSTDSGLLLKAFAWGMLLAVPVFFILRWRARERVALEFAVLLAIVAPTFVVAQAHGAALWRFSGIGQLFSGMGATVGFLSTLAIPLLYLIGLDIAEFTYRASGWASSLVGSRLPRRALGVVLVLVFLWRSYAAALHTIERANGGFSWAGLLPGYAGALGVPLVVGLAWWVVYRGRRPPGGEELAEAGRKAAPRLVLAFFGTSLALLGVILVAGIVAVVFGRGEPLVAVYTFVVQHFFQTSGLWVLAVYGLSLAASFVFLRRGRRALAFYLAVVGGFGIWTELTEPGRPLAALGWSGTEPAAFWWLVVFAFFAAFWLLRGRLTAIRMQRLLLLLIATALLGQTDFIEDPFSPFFGFTGIGLIALGVIWDALTLGSWANEGSPGLPRTSRIFLYVGYVLFSVAVINWAVTIHDLSEVASFTGESALGGFELLGKPLLYAIFAATLALPSEEEEAGDES